MVKSSEPSYRIDPDNVRGYSYDMGPARPPSEGQARSLLIRATRRCPWNKCLFCAGKRGRVGQKFEYKSVAEIKNDIDIVKGIYDIVRAASWQLGYSGSVNNEVLKAVVNGNPDIYAIEDHKELENRYQCLVHISNWIDSGARTAFIQDSDSMIMRTPELIEVLKYLKTKFPSIQRITTYARGKSINHKSQEELNAIHAAGLSRVHVGLESGSDEVLKFMEKGVTAQELIDSGKKTIEAGIELSEYVMPGLGGRKWSNVHALETARVLNEIGRPDFIRLRTLKIRKGTPLWDKHIQGEFALLTEDEMVDEMELMIQNLTCTSYLVSDHVDNLLFEVEGNLPQDKKKILDAIAKYKAMPVKDKLTFKLSKYTSHYYDYDHTDTKLDRSIREAWDCIEKNSPDAEEKVEKAIAAIFNYPYFQT